MEFTLSQIVCHAFTHLLTCLMVPTASLTDLVICDPRRKRADCRLLSWFGSLTLDAFLSVSRSWEAARFDLGV